MKCKYKKSKDVIRKIMIASLLVFLIFSGTYILFEKSIIPISKASSEDIEWDATIRVTESGGVGDEVIFGEALNASDGQDDCDLPKPPRPLQYPHIIVRLDTNLPDSYESLWFEYKQYPDDYKVWNLSVKWVPGPGDESPTTIDISWDENTFEDSEYKTIILQRNNTLVADMLKENSYTFDSNANILYRFQIICESETSNINETSSLSIVSMLITIVLFTLYLKKNN